MSASVHLGHSLILSIVFVHGILGDYKSAWTDAETGILWPRDLLPGHIPPSRILTFNYSPDFNDFFADDEDGPSQVAQHSRGLDLALHLFRAETKTVSCGRICLNRDIRTNMLHYSLTDR